MTIANRFTLLRPLRKGGMGSVWVATHTTLGTEVAIKFVDMRGESGDALRRFEREANVVARLRSPHVVQILDYGIDEAGRPYLAMELLNGESLKERLDRTKTLRLEEVVTLVIQACRALHRAHKAGIVHRDIKPANIFLSEEDDALHVKVLDFGVAKSKNVVPGPSDAQKTETGAIVGTPAYMSPEQVLASEEIDGRSDLYSLGVLAWRSLVGFNPHEKDGKALGFGELLIQIATKPVSKPSQYVEGISPEVDAWFARALALEASRRFANAKEMAEALAKATNMTMANAGTGAYAVSSADHSGPQEAVPEPFQDSDDGSAPLELAALRASGEAPAVSGAHSITKKSHAALPDEAAPKRRSPVVWIGLGAVVFALLFFAFRPRGQAPPSGTALASPSTGTSAPASAASAPVVADDYAAVPSPAPSASGVSPPAAAPSSVASPLSPAPAHPHGSPRGPVPTPRPAPISKPGQTDVPKKPTSPNTLLDDRL